MRNDLTVESNRGFGPFTTRIEYRLEDGSTRVWRSRDHRKRLGSDHVPALTWWIAVLFCIGSTCFTVGPLPAYESLAGSNAVGVTFFVGSIFFTAASYLCFVEAANAPGSVVDDSRPRKGVKRLAWWRPRSIDWWATGVQLVGTLYFNVMTFLALKGGWDVAQSNRLVWRPDAIGSICFLVASYLAWAEVCHSAGRLRFRDVSWWVVVLNLAGSVFFGLSAIGAYTLSSGEVVNLWLDNAGTVAGGVCFFVAAALLIPEARATRSESAD
ncbi:MAG: hypothetical protein V9E94_20070 [Microthrixaceae bacterium]